MKITEHLQNIVRSYSIVTKTEQNQFNLEYESMLG